MKGIEVKLKDAEKVKKTLLLKNLYEKNFKPKKTKTHIIFPILEEIKIKDTKIIEDVFERIKKNKIDFFDREIEIPNSYDILGSILILEIKEEMIKNQKKISEVLLKTHKQIKTILKKSGQHTGEFRTQKLSYLAGEKTKETIYKESNSNIKLDVEKVYFSPRLSTERKRIFNQVKNNENILVMFSGCGPYPITISKNTKAKHIIAIEKNPIAHKYALENLKLNKINNIEFIKGDVREQVPKLNEKFDRIIMPLPKEADTFLDIAFLVSKKGTTIHLYDFEHETEFDLVKEKIKKETEKTKIKYKLLKIVKCGQYSPGKYRICADFIIK